MSKLMDLMFVWGDNYRLNIPKFDAEHLVLVGLINQIYVALETGTAKEALPDIINALLNYIEIHFNNEEDVMDKCNYPRMMEHKKQHGNFTMEIAKLANRYYDTQDEGVAKDLWRLVSRWLMEHILREDKLYAQFLEDNNVEVDGLSLSPIAARSK